MKRLGLTVLFLLGFSIASWAQWMPRPALTWTPGAPPVIFGVAPGLPAAYPAASYRCSGLRRHEWRETEALREHQWRERQACYHSVYGRGRCRNLGWHEQREWAGLREHQRYERARSGCGW